MALKPYKPQIDEKQQVKEPAASYSCMHPQQGKIEAGGSVSAPVYSVSDEERASIMKAKEQYARSEYLTQEEMDKVVGKWLS